MKLKAVCPRGETGQVVVHARRHRQLRMTGSLLAHRVLTTKLLAVLISGVFRKACAVSEGPHGASLNPREFH